MNGWIHHFKKGASDPDWRIATVKTRFSTALFCFAAMTAAVAQPNDFGWLAGTWKLQNGNTYEIWAIAPNGDLSGYSIDLQGSDTVVTETTYVKFFDGAYHYIADVSGDQPPVTFKMTSVQVNGFVAENPRHDFPKRIRYNYSRTGNKEAIQASIDGDGKTIAYLLYKVK